MAEGQAEAERPKLGRPLKADQGHKPDQTTDTSGPDNVQTITDRNKQPAAAPANPAPEVDRNKNHETSKQKCREPVPQQPEAALRRSKRIANKNIAEIARLGPPPGFEHITPQIRYYA